MAATRIKNTVAGMPHKYSILENLKLDFLHKIFKNLEKRVFEHVKLNQLKVSGEGHDDPLLFELK